MMVIGGPIHFTTEEATMAKFIIILWILADQLTCNPQEPMAL